MLNMVRIIMGTLINVGTDKMNITDFKEIIKSKKNIAIAVAIVVSESLRQNNF